MSQTYAERIAAAKLINAARYPGRADFKAWQDWVRESHDRIEAVSREHYAESMARLHRIAA